MRKNKIEKINYRVFNIYKGKFDKVIIILYYKSRIIFVLEK